jgi:hypothetical protein
LITENPIFKNKQSIIIYLAFWMVFGTLHVSLLLNYTPLSVGKAVMDSVVYNGLFAILGLGIWFPVIHTTNHKSDFVSLLIHHISAALIIQFIWLAIGLGITILIYGEPEYYRDYLVEPMPWRLGMGTLYYFVIAMIYHMAINNSKLQERSMAEVKLKKLVKETELNMLKWQLNPHFLFNSLNSISSLTITHPEKAHEMIILLSDFLRYSLAHNKDEKTSLKSEIENIKSYLEIEQVRFGDKLICNFEYNSDIENMLIPNLILQPLYENAIKYGVQDSIEATAINTTIDKEENSLVITITNSCNDTVYVKKGSGVGLRNIEERLALIYGNRAHFSRQKQDDNFIVKLKIPQ